jgi:hypothetical protein
MVVLLGMAFSRRLMAGIDLPAAALLERQRPPPTV